MKGLCSWVLAALAVPGIAATPWNVARSDHFEVWSDAPADTSRALASGLERLRSFFVSQLGIVPSDVVRVICFASETEYAAFRIRAGAAGFSITGPSAGFIVTHSSGSLNWRVPAHEYAHLVIYSSGWKLPEWLAEGISEVVSGIRFGERYSFIGGDLPGRSQQARTTAWIPPAEFFALSLKGPPDPDPAREPLFYSQSWALAEMLIASPAYVQRFPAFIAMLSQGSTSPAAIEGVYRTTPAALFREARERLVRGIAPVAMPPVAEPGPVRVEAANSFDVRLTLAALRHAASQTELAEAAYRELAAERPGAPDVPAALGLIALERRDPDTAVREWSRAMALGLRDADLCLLFATLADARGLDSPQIRAALERAVAIRPGFDAAHFRLGLMDRNANRPAEALAHFQAMHPPPPDRASRYYASVADVLLELNRRPEAKAAALEAQRFASSDEERRQAHTFAYLADTEMTVEIVAMPDGHREFRTIRVPVNAARRNPFIEADEEARSTEATLRRVDCTDGGTRLVVSIKGGELSLAIADPSRVQIRNGGGVKFEFVCGLQKARPVLVEYTAGNILRGLELR
jgi:tetratricopeptide (TPR) repeat protein